MVQIGRKSSIESEPRTLRVNQIQYAREVAEFVMHTKSMDEAKRIFTKGLEPVASVIKQNGDEMRDSIDEFENSEDDYFRLTELRDVVSAPF